LSGSVGNSRSRGLALSEGRLGARLGGEDRACLDRGAGGGRSRGQALHKGRLSVRLDGEVRDDLT